MDHMGDGSFNNKCHNTIDSNALNNVMLHLLGYHNKICDSISYPVMYC